MALTDVQSRRRLLFLLPFAPRFDATHGGSRVMAQLLAKLAARHHVAILYLRAADELPVEDSLRERCELVEEIIRPQIASDTRQARLPRARVIISLLCGKPLWVTDWAVATYGARLRTLAQAWQPDLVQVEYHIMAQYLSALDQCPAPRVLTEYEPGAKAAYERWRSQQGQGQVIRFLDMLAWSRFERTIFRRVQAVVVFTERDRQAIVKFARQVPIVRIPLGTALPERALHPLGCPPASLVFVGNFVHPPNVDAAIRLSSTILLHVRKQYPEVILYIVGDNPPPQVRQLANAHVIVTGRVPEVTPYLDSAALVAVPLRFGGGMRVKVLEALAAGKAVVASPLAAEGLDLNDGEQIVLAESDAEFADAIVQLLADPERRAALASSARAWAFAHLTWDKVVTEYEALYQRLTDALQ